MRQIAILSTAALALAICPVSACADLCAKCKDKAYIMSAGECVECRGTTASGAFKLCKACSAKLNQCEHCRAALGGPSARESNSPAARTSAPTVRPATAPAAQPAGNVAFERIVLRDVQGLFGGQDPWLFVDGRLVVQTVRPRDRARPCARYAARLDANGSANLGNLLREHRFFEIQTRERFGVPDEARPTITVRMADGNERTVQKWASDKHADFDAIYKELLALVKSAGQGEPEFAGPYDQRWAPKPEGAPAAAPASQPGTALAKSLVPGRMVCSEACKAKLDLANGVKKCPGGCGTMCNVAHKTCTKCAATAGVCEVCGKAMAVGAAQELALDETSDGKTVWASVGQKIVIRIPSEGPGPRPPPQWTTKLDGESMKQEGEIRLRAKTIPGPGGLVGVQQGGPMVAETAFIAGKPGKTKITLEARPFRQPDAAPSETFTFTVDVQADAATRPVTRPG